MADVLKTLSFNDVPQALSLLLEKVTRLESLLETKTQAPKANDDEMMDLKGLQNFHPEHPAAATIYKWVRNGLIPYYKTGKKLIFKRSEIEAWINDGRQLTDAEIEAEAIDYINRRRAGK